MPLSALVLALGAAVVHATWNLLLHGTDDTHSAVAVGMVVGTAVIAPVALIDWRLDSAVWPYAVSSSAAEGLYLLLLATAYSVAAMSFVYPIARGAAPVLVLVAGALVTGAAVSLPAGVGVVLVAIGIVLVRGIRGGGRRRDLALALSVGACIATYTLIDKHGITHASSLAYVEVVFAITSLAYLIGVWRVRGGAALRAAVNRRTLLAGVGFSGAYALALAALRLAPAASVAAVRESSVVMATVVLAIGGREKIGPARLTGAVAVVAGIALISLG
ncbi:MAG TPA: EamA family transporter [Solirubrobacteraceae bacterium]|nr:EamA family transporter [Solirubrobacteraceae bacterium]